MGTEESTNLIKCQPNHERGQPTPNNLKTFEVWKEYEGVAMHFNDLLIRLRTQAIAGVAAIATLAAIIVRGDIAPDMRWDVLAASFFFLTMFWIAVWIIDALYYNRLLIGAVNALIEIEKASKSNKPLKEIILSTRIEDMFSGSTHGKKRTQLLGRSSKKPVFCFYLIVCASLVFGLVVSVAGLYGFEITGGPACEPSVSGIVEDAQTGMPVKGAKVMLASEQSPEIAESTITEKHGTFLIHSRWNWKPHKISRDLAPIPFSLTVQEAGYQPETIYLPYSSAGQDQTNNFKEIHLRLLNK